MNLTSKQDIDGKWGFVDEDGVWQITPLYDSVEPFDGDYARGMVNGHRMWIDKDGRWFKERPQGERPEEEDVFLDHPIHRSVTDILMDGFGKASSALHKGLEHCE